MGGEDCFLTLGGVRPLSLADLLSRLTELLRSMLASDWLALRVDGGPIMLLESDSSWGAGLVGRVEGELRRLGAGA